MTDYAWFPVSGDGETQATAFTWNVGTFSFNTGSYWANVDALPAYPITTGTVPGAVAGADSVYLFAGSAKGSTVDQFYTPNPSKGDPYIAKGADGNYDFSTDVLLNAGSVELNTLGLEEVNFQAGPYAPTLDIEGATLHVDGSVVSTYDPNKFPAGLAHIVKTGSQYAGLFGVTFPQPGGTIDLGGGGLLEVGGSIDPNVVLNFGTGTGNTLRLDGVTKAAAVTAGGTFTVGATITNFVAGDTIDLPNIPANMLDAVNYNAVAGTLDITVGEPVDIVFDLSGPSLTGVQTSADPGGGLEIMPCFAAGTRIATPRGEMAVEDLRIGDGVLTAAGALRPVVWIGDRNVDCRKHPRAASVWPVRVRAGAFGTTPHRDLLLSPDHAVYADGVLVPVKHLINGATIVQEDAACVHYFHIELSTHDVLLAEGLAVESYLDTGNRMAFEDGGTFLQLHPDFSARSWSDACAPLVQSGRRITALRRRLIGEARRQGYRVAAARPPYLQVGGERIAPARSVGSLHRFLLPEEATEAVLMSQSGVPAGIGMRSGDTRRLGLAVAGIVVDGRPLPLDHPALRRGFYPAETAAGARWRWTDGASELALPRLAGRRGPFVLDLRVAQAMRAWNPPKPIAKLAAEPRERRRASPARQQGNAA